MPIQCCYGISVIYRAGGGCGGHLAGTTVLPPLAMII
jgi:hypothetical protein